ncbi:MAG: polysaccharide deacetylase family protein [Desulfobacterales bacterium]|nr:polysaccharide deacetylase family protein [Desulfobacterales bacterium]
MEALLHAFLRFCFRHNPYQGIILGHHTQGGDQIRREVDALYRLVDFIGHDEMIRRLKQGGVRSGGKPFCLLTFDDGKKINADDTATALEALGIPAVFYLVTGAVTHGTPLWFDKRNALVRGQGRLPEILKPEALKQLPLSEIRARLDACNADNLSPPDMSDPSVAPMSWEDARRLDRKGFSIGAHTVSHPVLTNESKDTAEKEIRDSIETVSREIGRQCPSFAFPNGNWSPELARYTVSCGVKTIMATTPVWVRKESCTWALPRIDIYNHYDKRRIWMKLTAALPGCLLKNPNGSGRRYVFRNCQLGQQVIP